MAISKSISTPLAIGGVVLPILIFFAGIGGWIANIVKIFASAGDPITAYFVIRCIGVLLAPLGAILGFL